jgi:hypothetical protein
MLGSLKRLVAAAVAVAATAGLAGAAELPAPTGKVLLEIKGDIAVKNSDGSAIFDRAMLESLGTRKLQTSTPWTDGRPVFEGVLMRDVMKRVGADGETLTVVALNDYKITLPTADFEKYPVLLAFKMDGEILKVRDKGPLWIIYPQDEYDELRDKSVHRKWAWQIKEFNVE